MDISIKVVIPLFIFFWKKKDTYAMHFSYVTLSIKDMFKRQFLKELSYHTIEKYDRKQCYN